MRTAILTTGLLIHQDLNYNAPKIPDSFVLFFVIIIIISIIMDAFEFFNNIK